MRKLRFLTVALAGLAALVPMHALTISGLHTQHLTNPVGIDEMNPIFSWILESDKRGVLQESYQITVATDPEMGNIVWDSGVVNSRQSTAVKAVGFQPAPSTRYYWKVTVSDNKGETATSTQKAFFETGLLDSGWSGAQWIKVADNNSSSGGNSSIDLSTIKDYIVEADFEIERVAAGIIWGATDQNNYYMWQFNIERNPTKFRPHRWQNSGAACLAEIDVDLQTDKTYHMKVEVSDNGTVAKTFLDDKLIDTRTGSFPYGIMGVRSAMAENAARYYETSYYDDFKVTGTDGTVLYEDHFDNRDNYDNGKIVGGKLRTSGDYITWQQNFVPDENIKNYTVEGKFIIDQVAAGICFASPDNSHFYMWQFNIESGKPLFRPHRWNPGGACLDNVDLTKFGGLTQGKEYDFRIEVCDDGATAKTYLNNQLIDTRSGEYVYGRMGIRCSGGEYNTRTYERAFYDNFKTTTPDGTVIYSDDFDNPDLITLSLGDPIDGRLRVGAYSDQYSWALDTSSFDLDLHYTIEADMTLIRDNNSIIFSRTGTSHYHMWAINTADHATPCIRRHVYLGGSPDWSDTELTGYTKNDFLNKEHHIMIEVHANMIYTYIDGKKVDTFKDTSGHLTNGLIGFRANNGSNENEQAYWDNIKVTVHNPDGTSKVTMSEDFEGDTNQFSDAELVSVNGNTKLYMLSRNGETKIFEDKANGAPMFRKEFALDGVVKSAKLYTTALGNYTMYINGQRVGHVQDDGSTIYDEFMPGWTDYRKKVFYNTHDVTTLLKKGANAIGAQLSNGWWGGDIAHGVYGSPNLAFMCKLVIELESGDIINVVTDTSWTTSTTGAVKRGDIYHGETYDARDYDRWSLPEYTSGNWAQAAPDSQFSGLITAFEGPAVRIRKELERKVSSITVYDGIKDTGTRYGEINVIDTYAGGTPVNLKKGQTMIVDFGQNFVGWVKLNVKGESGTMLKMRFAEMLNDKGDESRGDDGPGGGVYTINLRNAKCLLNYVLAGNSEGETYSPTTSFYGFRYCELTATRDVTVNSIVGEVVGSEIEEGSSIKVNHDAVNQLYNNVLWGQRSNFLSVPTDCPQRDERLGWTADTQIFSMAASYNSNTLAFYHKWMGDMRDSQREDGAYPDVAPYCWVGFGQAAWGDAGIILPWNVYTMYGDRTIIEENYESMERYMNYVATLSGNGYKYNGAGTNYGDWVSFEATESRYVSVAYYAYMADIMSRMSKVMSENVGDEYDIKATKYAELFEAIKAEFNQRYVSSSGSLKINSQTAMLLALRFNLMNSDKPIEDLKERLRAKIVNNGNKLSTGFVGTGIINQTLSDYGMDDLAYTLLLQRECPSWLYSVDQGATTIWERWDSYTKERGFHSDITMNSFNHYAYGAVAEWMYRYMAGIAPDSEDAGFSQFELKPTPDNRTNLNGQQRITQVDATYASNSGKIRSAWTRNDDGSINYSVTVPANTTAKLYFPVSSADESVMEGKVKASEAEGVEALGVADGKAMFKLGSGSYVFAIGDPSGVSNVILKNGDITVFPNPTYGQVTVKSDIEINRILVSDLAGRNIINVTGTDNVDLTKFPAGMYVLTAVAVDGTTKVEKIVKR